MFDYAPSAELFHCPKAFQRDGAVLDVQLLETSAVISDTLDALITDHFTALDTELLEVRAVFREHLQSHVSHIALANIQGPQS